MAEKYGDDMGARKPPSNGLETIADPPTPKSVTQSANFGEKSMHSTLQLPKIHRSGNKPSPQSRSKLRSRNGEIPSS